MPERLRSRQLPLTPEYLLLESRAFRASGLVKQWQEAKERKQGELTLVVLCSDARLNSVLLFNNAKVASVSTIAANGETEPFRYLLNHGAIGQVVVVGHYNSEDLKPGEPIQGCGGLNAKRQIVDGQRQVVEGDDFGEYINRIEASDPVTQTVNIVNKLSSLTDKPIFGTAVDHITYRALPVAQSVVDENGIRHTVYNQEVYKKAADRTQIIPVIPENELDQRFIELLRANNERADELNTDQEFMAGQRVQNPRAVILSTSPLPLALRYPRIFGDPNTGFVVRLPFSKKTEEDDMEGLNQSGVKISKKYLKEAVAQLRYPLEHAVNAQTGQDFSETQTFIIETANLELSAEIARRLIRENKFIGDWIMKRDGKIIISEVKSGETTQSQYYPPNYNNL